MNKNDKTVKEVGDNKDKDANNVAVKENQQQLKLGVFEEDDYFEEFDDEEWNEQQMKEDVDFKQWQEEWEDEEINDQFEKVLKREIDAFKSK